MSDVTLTFPIETLAHLAQILGRRSGSEGSREEAIATSSFYNAVTGEVFNRYWDDAVDEHGDAWTVVDDFAVLVRTAPGREVATTVFDATGGAF